MNQQHATAGAAASTSGVGLGYRDPLLARPVADRAGWQEIDVRAVDTARLLAADAVQKAGSGHPGTAMSLAPLAYLLFQNVLVHDPADEQWLGRESYCALGRAHQPGSVHPVVPVRVRAGDRGPGGTTHLVGLGLAWLVESSG
jgi:Transketolase, thiamine diphosphate binding domain